MNRRISVGLLFIVAVGCLSSVPARARAQSFAGKWVFQGPRGVSVIEFFPGEKRAVGPMRGAFHHTIILDDGRVIEGNGTYTFRYVVPKRGWLTLRFADGHATTEHEHTVSDNVLSIRHHGTTRNYIRQ